jgi:hypothetical protein
MVRADDAGPRFRAEGPDADTYGREEGYPSCTGLTYIRDQRRSSDKPLHICVTTEDGHLAWSISIYLFR